MAHENLPRYRSSGRLALSTLPLFIAAAAAGVGTAWLYQSLMSWLPYIYVNLLICFGFGAGLGVAGAFAVRRGHCRNRIVALALAVPLALAPIGASYYFAYRDSLTRSAASMGVPVDELREHFGFRTWLALKQEWGWRVSSSHSGSGGERDKPDISGAGVLVVWAIEALIISGLTLLIVDTEAAKPYCESCRRWCTQRPLTLQGLTRADLEGALQMGDLGAVVDLELRGQGDPARALVLTASVCDGCSDTGFLSVDEKLTVQRKKQTSSKTTHLVRHALLSAEQRAAFVRRHNFAVGQKLAA